MMPMKFSLSVSLLFLLACTPKVAEVVTETTPITKSEPLTPCMTFDKLPGYERELAKTAFVVYKDYYRAKKYDEALIHWKDAYRLAPAADGKAKYQFDDGVNIYKIMLNATADVNQKKNYIDTINMIYDKRQECFGDEAYVNGLKGFDYFFVYPEFGDEETTFELLKSNLDVKGKNMDYFVINPFTKLLVDRIVDEKIMHRDAEKYMNLINAAVTNGKSTCKGSLCESWKIIEDYTTDRFESLESVDDFYDCTYYTEKYYTLFENNQDSCEIINLAYGRMSRGKCNTNDEKMQRLRTLKSSKCAPPVVATSCARLGYDEYSNGNYKKAVAAFESCVELSSDAEQKARLLLLIAKIHYRDLKNYPKARKYALDAASLKVNWGEPYLLIGNLYASSGPLCGSGRGWESQIVTWAAIDMWHRAKNIDPTTTTEATKLINTYSQYMPSKEDVFFRGLKVGDSYFIPCWIQTSTTIRTSD